MRELEDLDDIDKAILLACCDANKFSLKCHVSIPVILKKLENRLAPYFKKRFKKLCSDGFMVKHPVGHKTTYNLSKKGLKAGNQLKDNF